MHAGATSKPNATNELKRALLFETATDMNETVSPPEVPLLRRAAPASSCRPQLLLSGLLQSLQSGADNNVAAANENTPSRHGVQASI
jgi:hypothetical protein